MSNHKLGIHVTGQDRDNYGMAAPQAVVICSIDDPSAFDEAPEDAILIHRTHKAEDQYQQHIDAPSNFDSIPFGELYAAGAYWWGQMRNQVLPVTDEYDCYFQPVNEINNRRVLTYMRGYAAAAERDGVKLALLGDAAGSPDRLEWLEHWVPFLADMEIGGHIYCCHVYSGLPHETWKDDPANLNTYLTNLSHDNPVALDSNSDRPFWMAQQLKDRGVNIPIVISELGWLRGWEKLPFEWINDIIAYNQLMMEHDNIIGGCLWNAGQWETAPNILGGRNLADLAAIMATMKPQFYDPNATPLPEPLPVAPVDPAPVNGGVTIFDPYRKHVVTAVLFPQDVPLLKLIDRPEWADVLQEMDAKRRSMFWSHHDAVWACNAGLLGSKLVIYGNRSEAIEYAESFNVAYEVRPIPERIEPITVPDVEPEPPAIAEPEPFQFEFWPTEYKKITQAYGANPSYYGQFGLPGHEGIDIRAPHGSMIFAVTDGTVYRVYDDPRPRSDGGHNYGIHVRIQHRDGYKTVYAHLDRRVVNAGDVVTAGQIIGYADNTGNSFGSHLHLTLKLGDRIIDPTPFIKKFFEEPEPVPAPEPVAPKKKYNIWDAMTNGKKPFGRPYEVRHSDGSQSSFQLQYDPFTKKHYMVKGDRRAAEYEEFWLEDGYIWRGIDTSRGGGTYYVMSENNRYGARWLPAEMEIGESFTRSARVRVYSKDGRLISDDPVTDTMTLAQVHPRIDFSTGISAHNVFELQWSGGETAYHGEDENGETFGLVAWGRTHQDPNSPEKSEISEVHNYGDRPNSVRESVIPPVWVIE